MWSRYRRIWQQPGLWSAWLASLLGRLQLGLLPLSLLLCVRAQTGSFAAAGVAAGVQAITTAGSSPAKGRAIDRYGVRRVLPWMAGGHALLLVLIAGLGAQLPLLVLMAMVGGSGLLRPNLTTYMRSLFRCVLDDQRWTAANALEASISPLLMVAGPLLAAGLITLWGAPAALMVCGAATLLGSWWFAASALHRRPDPQASGVDPLRWAPLLLPLLCGFSYAAGMGCLQVALPRWCEQQGVLPLAGVLLGAWAAGGLVGGLVYGLRSWRPSRQAQLLVLSVWGLVAAASLPLAPGWLVLLGLLALAGLPSAPLTACIQDLMQRYQPTSRINEAFAWWVVISSGGVALGNALTGALSQHVSGSQLLGGVAVANLLAALCAAAGWRWRREKL